MSGWAASVYLTFKRSSACHSPPSDSCESKYCFQIYGLALGIFSIVVSTVLFEQQLFPPSDRSFGGMLVLQLFAKLGYPRLEGYTQGSSGRPYR